MSSDDLDSFLDEKLDGQQDEGGDLDSILDSKLGDDKRDDSKISYRPEVYFSSSESMDEVEDESVELIVTSPPYNADWAYGSVDDDLDYATEYIPMLARVFKECYRVLRPGGRMVVNTPSMLRGGTEGGVAIASHINTMLDESSCPFLLRYDDDHEDIAALRSQTDWISREWITWYKQFNPDGLAPNGSFPRPWGILLNNMHEVAVVYQKSGDRDYDDMGEKIIEESKINKWSDDLCDDVWTIKPANHEFEYVDGEDVPPFPEEFVKRCIALWTYKDDTVLDPFFGRGTVGKVAKRMERESIGYELRKELEDDITEYMNANQSQISNW